MNNILDLYSDYLIVQNKYATSTGLSEMLNGAISHDKVTRFLNKEELASKELWRYITHLTQKLKMSIKNIEY